jgi:hypothetical protein
MPAMSFDPEALPPPEWGRSSDGWYRLASVLRAALLLNVVVYAFDVVASWWAAHTLATWVRDPGTIDIATAQRIDDLNRFVPVTEVLLLLVTGILFICWLYQAHGRPLAERSALRMGRGWSIGGWFVPLANYVIPYRVVQGVNAATTRPPRGDSGLIIGWWAGWVVFAVLGLVARAATPDTGLDHGRRLLRDIQTADTWNTISAAPGVVAALLAALVVARVTSNVQAVVVRPEPAATPDR